MLVITRYKNRKMYIPKEKRFVTSRDIWNMYKDGLEFRIELYGQDVTHDVILSSAITLLKGSENFSQRFLKIVREII